MTRREALAKATITTTDAASGLLDPQRGSAFVRQLKEKGPALAPLIRQEVRVADTGEIDKLATGQRLLRAATENADDGYRVGATFSQVSYTTKKVRLPWEITEDLLHANIEGAGLESTLLDEMTTQFALDLEDLDINGDTAAAVGPDQPFLQIDDGILKLVAAAAAPGRNIDAAAAQLDAPMMFDALYALPNKYRNPAEYRWIMSPARKIKWWETITTRATAAGDTALLGQGQLLNTPLGISILEVPAWPDNVVMLANPKNFVRVISWQVRRRKVTGETDAELAAKDKRFYVFFIKRDVVVEEFDAIVRVFNLGAI